MFKLLTVSFFLLLLNTDVFAQGHVIADTTKIVKKYRATIINGDTIAIVNLHPYFAIDKRIFKNKRKEKRYYSLVAKVKKVLPIAREAGRLYKTLNSQLVNKSDKDKIFLMRRVENEIKKKYTKTIENLSYTEGMILLKLIDRETGNSAYHLVEELRGEFKAWFWQGVGRFFDVNLKQEYDPVEDDKDIEEIVFQIDKGIL
jgi:hypothetical protein